MLHLSDAMGPHLPGSNGYRAWYAANVAHHMDELIDNMMLGATPGDVAAYVLACGIIGVGLSMRIENVATDGSFAEAVFDILCNG